MTLWESRTSYRSGTKICKGETPPTTCTDYEYTDGRYPLSGDWITAVGAFSSLTSDHCKHLCSHYSQCESVRYWRRTSDDYRECRMYKTTLSNGEVVECSSSYSPCGTYKRLCEVDETTNTSERPTISLPPSTTQPPNIDCPTHISEFHGALTCLPIGHSQEECEAITGCCYLEWFSTGLCLQPVLA